MTSTVPLTKDVASGSLMSEQRVVDKIFRRLIWFLFVAAGISYLDRINMAFAGLRMNESLGLTATTYGLAGTISYVGYVLCEIPSNMLMVRFGARYWISRIMITWGIASSATMLVYDTRSLYVVRFILGVAEAGFTPGVFLFLTFWLPKAYRGRATSYFVAAQALAQSRGSLIAGSILGMPDYLGIASWRWLFLLEGLPAVILGIVGLFYLTDAPAKARWLNGSEKAAIQRVLTRENGLASPPGKARASLIAGLLNRRAILLGFAYFGLSTTFSVNAVWVPLIVREMVSGVSVPVVAYLSAIPPAIAIIMLFFWGRSSDRRNERFWHTIAAFGLGAVGWALVGLSPVVELRFLGLIFCSVAAWCGMSMFWTIPALLLSARERPAGIAAISTIGLLAAAFTPTIIGSLRDLTGSFTFGVAYAAGALFVAGALLFAASSGSRDRL